MQVPQDRNFAQDIARQLLLHFASNDGAALLELVIRTVFPGRIALVSSFGAEAAVLLHMVSRIDKATPVIFLDTGKHFPETLAYRNRLVSDLGLSDVRSIAPDSGELAEEDPTGGLWHSNSDACCDLRKTRPLNRALADFDAWITGRKRIHGELRESLPLIEAQDGKIKINPLAHWGAEDLATYALVQELEPHPLVAAGYDSIGCANCTSRTLCPSAPRSGRWKGLAKTECGIHFGC
jgi:phosphoadenosine phosphosulfate reductase